MADYKKKKGASGKKYTTLGEQILVTYTDGSTRRVKPGDATYEVTKRDMQKDIKAKKFWKPAGNSKTTAETAVGKGVTDGIITTAEKNKLAEQAQAAAKQRKQAQAVRKVADGRSKQPATEQAKVLNNAINAMIAKKAVDTVKSAPKVVKSGVEHGIHNTIAGTKQGAVSGMSNLGRGGMAEAMPYMAVAEKLGAVKPGTHTDLMQQQKDGMEALQRVIAENTRRKSQQISDKYGPMSNGERFISDFIAGLLPMGAAVAGGAIAGPAGAIAPMYNYAKGASVTQALNDGADYDEAQAYGIGKGAVDTGASMIFKGMAGLPGKFKAGEKVAGMVTNPALKKAGSALTDVASEGAEEALAEIIDPFLQRATYNEDAKLDWNRVLESAIMGTLTAGAFNAGAAGLRNLPKLAGNVQENDNQRAFDALHSQNYQQKQVENAETAQNRPEQAQTVGMTENPRNIENGAQEQNMQADFQQKPVKNVQNRETVENTPKITLKMSERTFENVGDKNVRAYQQENPAVKPFYQRVADNLLADLQEGIKGGRDAGVDPETRTVTTMGGWQREQSEPIERMLRDGMTYNQIEDGLQRIVEDNGKENTANAKRAELYVDEAVRNGYRSVVEGDVSADRSFAYRGMTAEQLQEVYNRLENSFTGNPETDAGIISEMETVQNLLDGMQQKQGTVRNSRTVAENTTVDEEFSEAGESDRYQELIDEYGAIPKGEDPYGNNRDIDVPRQTNDFDKTRKWTRTAMEAEQVDDVTTGMIADDLTSDMQSGRFVYEPTSNQKQVNRANRLINQTGWKEQAENFRNKYRSGESMNADDIALGERLIQEAQKSGDYETAVQLIADVAAIGTEAGRSVQALKILKRLTPEGKLMALKRIENRINSSLVAQKKEPVVLPEEIAEEMLQTNDPKKHDEIWDKAIKEMANQVPATLADKINAWRYLAMLSNPKTHIRNMFGNATMRAVMNVKNVIQTGAEVLFLPSGNERTAAIMVPKEYRDFAKDDYKEHGKRMLEAGGGSRYNDELGLISQNKRIFKNQTLENSRKFNSDLLKKEDMFFSRKAYIDAMSRYMYANGLSPSVLQSQTNANNATYEKAQKYALQQAKKATFQEASKVAQKLSEIENLNTDNKAANAAAKIAMGSLVPFKKTPINILKRGVEYSPLGIVNGVSKAMFDVKKGDVTPADAIDAITAGMTGTGIMILGYFMASQGWLSAGADDDDQRKARYDSQMGNQNYALVFSDGSTYTIDWLAPSVMPLMVGAEFYKQRHNEQTENDSATGFTRALEALTRVGNPLLEMSMMQGLTDAIQSYNTGTGQFLSDFAISTATGFAGQFIPQPMAAWARTIDDTIRSSYASKESAKTKEGESFLRQQRSKIPDLPMLSEMGLSSVSNEPSIDVWGNERKREFAGDEMEQVLARTFNNFLNPGTYSSNKRTELDLTLEALYKDTGDSGVLPKSATNYVTVDGTNYHKTPAEKTAYDRTKGQKSKQYVSDFVNSSAYANLDNTTKTNIVEELYNLANYEAKKEMLGNRDIDYSDSQYENVLDSGVSPHEYYATKQRFGGKFDQYNHAVKYAGYADKMQMKDEKFVEVYDSLGDLHADKDKNGKSKSGSRRKKVETYLDEERSAGRITKEQYWYFLTKEYPSEAKNAPYAWIREANKQ